MADGTDLGERTAFMGPLDVGTVIDDLTLVRKLGEGAQGVVFEARQSAPDRRVAVKLLSAGSQGTPSQIGRFKREAEAAGRLNHPNIVGTHAFREWRGQYLIVQELLPSGDLEDEIQHRHASARSNTDDLQNWMASTCRLLAQALQFAHQNGVIHRDIKPGNVLLTSDGLPKITDFGLAMLEDDAGISRTGVAVGTPYYMSPEQVRAERGGLDHRTDVYSLGAVAYRMLTGRVPFSGKTRQGLLLDILTRDPEPIRKSLTDIDRDLEAVVLKCLEKDPNDRYPSAQALADDLHRWEEGLGTSARPASMVSMPFRRMRRQATSGLVLLAALVVLAALAIDLGLLLPASREQPSVHLARQAALVLGAFLFMWPLTVLVRRVAGGRGWARIPVVVLVLLLTTAGARGIEFQRLDQLQSASRLAVIRAAGTDQAFIAGDLVEAHIQQWQQRFGVEDLAAVAYAYLSMGRYTAASDWTLRSLSMDGAAQNPGLAALQYASFHSLGQDQQAAEAEARLFSLMRGGGLRPSRLAFVGEVLSRMGRFTQAEEAFRMAAQDREVDRDAVDFALARLHAQTCRWDEAQRDVDALLRWRSDDVGVRHWAHRIAVGRHDWATAEEHLAWLERSPRWHFLMKFDYLLARDRPDQARDFALEIVELEGSDTWTVSAAAWALYTHGWMPEAQRLYERLQLIDGTSVDAHVGLSAISLKAGQLETAETQARRALELQPDNDIALYNLSQVELYRLVADHSPDTERWPLAAWERWLAATESCLAVNGVLAEALNNAAYAYGQIHMLSTRPEALPAALDTIRRAIRRSEPNPESRCLPGAKQREDLSRAFDTLATIQEGAGDLPAALDAARLSLGALSEGDTSQVRRAANLERLQQSQLSGG